MKELKEKKEAFAKVEIELTQKQVELARLTLYCKSTYVHFCAIARICKRHWAKWTYVLLQYNVRRNQKHNKEFELKSSSTSLEFIFHH